MGKGGGTKMATSTSDIPSRFRPFVDENLALAGTLANTPYQPFQGPTLAGFQPDQIDAFNQVRGMRGQIMPQQQAANAATAAGMNSIVNPDIMMGKYQNQFQDSVIDNLASDLGRERDRMNATARLQSPYGGSRSALIEAENNRNMLDRLASQSGQLRMQNFQDSARLGQAGTGQLMQGANQIMNQAAANQKLGLDAAGALSGIGQQIQGMQQAAMSDREKRFLDEINHPLAMLNLRQQAVGLTPMGSVSRTPISGGGTAGGLLSGLGGLAQGAAAMGLKFGCWVAREAYGPDNPKWLSFRTWMYAEAPDWLFNTYMKHGERFAKFISNKPKLKSAIRWMMDKAIG
tara:strand:+ start:211 stop:1248 length:1038 start_codon:yes stop_codon:yes gene_type:complete